MEGLALVAFGAGLALMQFTVHMANFIKSYLEPRLDVDKVAAFIGIVAFTLVAAFYAVMTHI